MAVALDLDGPLLPVLGVGDGTVEGEDDPPEVPGVGVPDVVPAEDVGLAGVDPVGVADVEFDGCAGALRCGELLPPKMRPTLVPVECPPETAALSGFPIVSSKIVMAATTTRKNPAAMPQ